MLPIPPLQKIKRAAHAARPCRLGAALWPSAAARAGRPHRPRNL